uniref:26S proteasome non-ATPase regulatory subunit 5 n=1 Tax=Ciona intestinalis TaxID=7719 RepID=UPI0000521272|nr:26S proteasome non-ATPase regulatory subunit 5 [Ciona intestinalis]|eukprot:XP_002129100.1 26S proteasome non-ATPase regulatory subunit 5 [Ciona intestinalis]
MDEGISSLIRNLSISDDRLQTLTEIKTFVVSSHSSTLKNVVQASDLETLFQCLENNDRDEVEAICFILSSLLPIVDPVDVAVKLASAIQNGLTHPNPDVQHLTLKELQRVVAASDGATALSDSPDITRFAIFLVGDADESLAAAAVKFLSEFGRTSPNAARTMLKPDFQPHYRDLKTVMQKNDVVKFRVYEIVCNIQAESQEMLDLCVESGIVSDLVKELDGSDVLGKVTCCTMLSGMASSNHSLDYLVQAGVVSKMTEMLKDSITDPFSDLYVPGVIRFFGNLSLYNGPKFVLEIFPNFCKVIFTMVGSNDPPKQQVAMETLGIIGETLEGKKVLSEQGDDCTTAVQDVCQILKHGKQDMRLIAVDCMSRLLDHKKVNENETDVAYKITLSWFRLLSSNPIDTIINLCKQPFTDIRCSGFALLNTLADCQWGVEAMVEFATLVEFLLDRSTETEKSSKDAKFAVIKTLTKSPNVASIFGNRNYLRFRQFLNEGPYYVGTQLSVAIDEA